MHFWMQTPPPVSSTATGVDLSSWIAILIAVVALLFSVLSFWWLNARRGRLVTYEPHSFAAHVSKERVLLRLPLVLYNTGAVPIVVQNLRLYFPHEDVAMADMPWRTTRRKLRPDPDDVEDLPAVFAVPGRTAQQRFIEFGGPFPAVVPQARDYIVRVEAKLNHDAEWTEILTFTLRAKQIISPSQYIAYSNSDVPPTAAEVKKAEKALRDLAEHFGVELPDRQE